MASSHSPTSTVVVVTGMGAIGMAVARRLGGGRLLVAADSSPDIVTASAATLQQEGFQVFGLETNIANPDSVAQLANYAASLGPIGIVVHTAGLSPLSGVTAPIYRVNLLGTALMIDAFQPLMSHESAFVCLSSSAAHFEQGLTPEDENFLSTAPTDKLLQAAFINLETDDPGKAYRVSKRGNILRVQSAAAKFASRGSRINVVSPGMTASAMSDAMLSGPDAEQVRDMIAKSPFARMAAGAEIADAVAFLAGTSASFITATELLVDGGVTQMVLQGMRNGGAM